MLHSCWPNKLPEFVISDNFEFVKDKNGTIVRNITIEKYDIDSNFMGKKYIYKNSDSEGESLIYLFANNEGYHVTGDTMRLGKGFVYRVYLRTLGFADTLVFKP